MRKILQTIDRALAAVENTMIITIVTVMVTLAFLQVILRNMDMGLTWAEIFLRHLVLWVGFIGASLATREEKHLGIDLITRYASKKVLPYFKLVIDIATMIICIVLANAAIDFIRYEIEAESTLFSEMPAWPFQIIIPVGFALIAFRFFLKFLEHSMDIFNPDENKELAASGTAE